jgi:hypothetical protein
MLAWAAGSGIGKNGHRSLAGEVVEIADEVGLIEVIGVEGAASKTGFGCCEQPTRGRPIHVYHFSVL